MELRSDQRELLVEILAAAESHFVDIAKYGDPLALSLPERNQVRLAIGCDLAERGIDEEGFPTPRGRRLEELIHLLGPREVD